MVLLVSACLLGVSCRYDGTCKPNDAVLALAENHTLIPFCPEIYGGLATPRPGAERVGDRVLTEAGADVTAQYRKGADEALRLAKLLKADAAILKARSPSCGTGVIHNGRFDGGLTQGDGITAALLRQNGIPVLDENSLQALQSLASADINGI